MSCDVRIAGPHAKFAVTFTKLGLHPGGGCTFFLTQALGRQRALSLILDGGVLDADEALRLGVVLEVVDDPLEHAIQTTARWAAIEPALSRDIKRAVGIAEAGGFDATLDFESWAQAASTRSPLLAEAIARFTR
jgi:enoyl-CoA hydratase